MGFVKDKALGDKAELGFMTLLDNYANFTSAIQYFDHIITKTEKKNSDYDVKFTATTNHLVEKTFELKFDVMSQKTGNLAIEYWNSRRNEPSGIMATKADYWVHAIQNEDSVDYYIISCSDLKEFLKTEMPLRIVVGAGDGNADLYLYKKDKILPNFRLVDSDVLQEILQ